MTDVVNTLIGIKPLFKIMTGAARNVLISNAEKKGIAWQEESAALLGRRPELEALRAELEDPRAAAAYPAYYLRAFHGYEDGNMNWLAAAECNSATLSMATRVWPTEDLTFEESQARLRASYLGSLQEYWAETHSGPIKAVADIGCSVGVSTAYLREAYPDAEVTGLDLSPYFLSVAKLLERERAVAAGPDNCKKPVRWVHGQAEATGFPEASLDAVLVTFVVHELPAEATRAVLAEALRVLRPGGVLAVTDIDPKSPVIQNLPRAISTLMKSTEPWSDEYYVLDMEDSMTGVGFEDYKYVVTDPRHSTYYARKPGKAAGMK